MIEPYIGLRSFDHQHVRLFFGRDRVVENLISTLANARFIAVIGTSGVGKSSVVRAGLRPALEAGYLDWKGGAWDVVEFRPGADPISRMAKALAESDWSKNAAKGETTEARTLGWKKLLSDTPLGLQRAIASLPRKRGERLLIIVDQFEETFRLPQSAASADDERARKDAVNARRAQTRAFLDLLLAAANSDANVYVVVTMRSEFLGECAEHPPLAEAVNRGLFLVSTMTESELRDAICMPALLAGKAIEPALADALIDETRGEQFQLPMLQHFLMRAWREGNGTIETEKWLRRQDDKVGKDSDQKAGRTKLKKAPAEVLDEDLSTAYSGLSAAQKIWAQQLFKRITVRRDGNDTRDPAPLKQIAEFAGATPDELRQVLAAFRGKGRCFLEPLRGDLSESAQDNPLQWPDDTIIDITHEAIIFNWGELQSWIGEEAEQARTLEDLWRKSQSGRSMTREEMEEGRRLLKLPVWATRYEPLYQRSHGGDLSWVQAFLDERLEDADRQDLLKAFQEGLVDDIERLALERKVRLTSSQLEKFHFRAHYYALLPGELWDRRDKSASSPAETEDVLKMRRAERIVGVFNAETCKPKTIRGHSVAHFAAWGGSTEIIDRLKAIAADLNDENDFGDTPFYWAVSENKHQAAERFVALLGNQETVGKVAKTGNRHTPLHAAADKGDEQMLRWLLSQAGPSINTGDKHGYTPLHYAANAAHLRGVEAFAAAAQDVDQPSKYGWTPLVMAAGQRDLACVRALLARNADAGRVAEDGATPITALFAHTPTSTERQSAPRLDILKTLLASPNGPASLTAAYSGSNALHLALEATDPASEIEDVIQTLVENGAPVTDRNWSNRTPVEIALRRGLTSVAITMAQSAANDHKCWADWLVAAIDAENEAALYHLLEINSNAVAEPGRGGRTPLHAAALAAEPWMLYALLNDDSDHLEVLNAKGETPLRLAMYNGKTDAVRALIAAGAEEPALVKFKEGQLAVIDQAAISDHLRNKLSLETPWPFGMILSGEWRDCTTDEAIQRLLPLYQTVGFALSPTAENIRAVRSLPLKSVANSELCQALVHDGKSHSYYTFIAMGDANLALDGGFEWFSHARRVRRLRLDDAASVAEYVRLTYASWERDGISIVLDSPERGFLAGVDGSDEALAKVNEAMAATPFRIDEKPIDGRWHGECVFKYKRSIVKAEFIVKVADGGVQHTLTDVVPRQASLSFERLDQGLYTSI